MAGVNQLLFPFKLGIFEPLDYFTRKAVQFIKIMNLAECYLRSVKQEVELNLPWYGIPTHILKKSLEKMNEVRYILECGENEEPKNGKDWL